jgi:hypothetical protein
MGGIQTPGVSRRREIPLRHVETGEYPYHTRHALGFVRINGQHTPCAIVLRTRLVHNVFLG